MPLAACILLASGIRAHAFSLFWPGSTAILSTPRSPFSGSPASPRPSASSTTWTASAQASPESPRSFSRFSPPRTGGETRSAPGRRHRRCRPGLSALEFQSRPHLHGRWRRHVARLPDGDSIAETASFGSFHGSRNLAPVLVLGATIFDTTLVSISRSRRGLLPFTTPGKDHTAHRLSNCGLGTRRAVLVMH